MNNIVSPVDCVDFYHSVFCPSCVGSLLIEGCIPTKEAFVSGAEASLFVGGFECPHLTVTWGRRGHAVVLQEWGKWLPWRTWLEKDVQLFLSSRCHYSQWLLQLSTQGVNQVSFSQCCGCSPSVPSMVLAFVSGHQLTPGKDPC